MEDFSDLNPPPLMAIDAPNPPNVVIKNSEFMLNTRQIVTASRLDPDLLTSCASKDIDELDLDRMYMDAMMEDFKNSVTR